MSKILEKLDQESITDLLDFVYNSNSEKINNALRGVSNGKKKEAFDYCLNSNTALEIVTDPKVSKEILNSDSKYEALAIVIKEFAKVLKRDLRNNKVSQDSDSDKVYLENIDDINKFKVKIVDVDDIDSFLSRIFEDIEEQEEEQEEELNYNELIKDGINSLIDKFSKMLLNFNSLKSSLNEKIYDINSEDYKEYLKYSHAIEESDVSVIFEESEDKIVYGINPEDIYYILDSINDSKGFIEPSDVFKIIKATIYAKNILGNESKYVSKLVKDIYNKK